MAAIAALIFQTNILRNNKLKTKTKRAAALLLMLAQFAPLAARAQTAFGGGSGTYTDPYIISTTDHWIELANSVNAVVNPNTFFNQFFRLDADLDFNGINFQPVGNSFRWTYHGDNGDSIVSSRIFRGYFNGNGHSIKNVTYHGDNDFEDGQGVGLFGYVENATIKNLTLAGNSTITGCNMVGGIVGTLGRNSTVSNCLVAEGVTIAQAPTSYRLGSFGGIVGSSLGTYSTVANCFSYATVASTCDYINTGINIVGVGGVMGVSGPNIFITKCGFFGQVTGITYVGAICGYKEAGSSVTNCYVGGDCTTGAIGVEGSSEGTNDGIYITYVCAIFYGENVGATYYTEGLASCNGRTVYDYNTRVDLKLEYTGTPPTGYNIWDAHYEVDGGTLNKNFMYTDNFEHANNRYILRLPSQPKSTITFVSLDLLRDISYEPWVSITVPACPYTGENQPPPSSRHRHERRCVRYASQKHRLFNLCRRGSGSIL